MITVAEARARGIALPTDNDAASGIVIEQEAWLARKIGPLDGFRTETFYVGLGVTHGKLALSRYTDAVTLTDGALSGASAVNVAHYRLVDNGSAVVRAHAAPSQWWTGPYVRATYAPTDDDEVRRVLFELVALEAKPIKQFESETMGAYSYTRGNGSASPQAIRASLVASLIPKRDSLVTIYAASRHLGFADPVINRAEAAV